MSRFRLSQCQLFFVFTLLLFVTATPRLASAEERTTTKTKQPIPVIYDSDLGDDIDDTWALALMLRSPELDVKLVLGDMGRSNYRAKLFAKFLETAKRTEVPVGIGPDYRFNPKGWKKDWLWQQEWIKDYNLKKYPGKVHKDGIQAMIDIIMNSKETVTVIAVGPPPNIAEALKREPRIAQRAHFVGLYGAVYKGHRGKKKIHAEYNARTDITALRKVFKAPWKSITITPHDTFGFITLQGKKYKAVLDSNDPLAKAVIKNYRIWWPQNQFLNKKGDTTLPDKRSTGLYDTVGVYLAFSQKLCKMEKLPIVVDDEGYTRIDKKNGTMMNVAVDWKNLRKFEDLISHRLSQGKQGE